MLATAKCLAFDCGRLGWGDGSLPLGVMREIECKKCFRMGSSQVQNVLGTDLWSTARCLGRRLGDVGRCLGRCSCLGLDWDTERGESELMHLGQVPVNAMHLSVQAIVLALQHVDLHLKPSFHRVQPWVAPDQVVGPV